MPPYMHNYTTLTYNTCSDTAMDATPIYKTSSKTQDNTWYNSHSPQNTPPNGSLSNLSNESSTATYEIMDGLVADMHATLKGFETPPAGRGHGLEEGDYEEVEGGGGEGEYHVLREIVGEEETYDVPVSSAASNNIERK